MKPGEVEDDPLAPVVEGQDPPDPAAGQPKAKEEPVITSDGGVEVIIEKNAEEVPPEPGTEPPAPPAPAAPAKPALPPDPTRSLRNKIGYMERQLEEQNKTIAQMRKEREDALHATPPPSTGTQIQGLDDPQLESLVKTDWKLGVRKVAELVANDIVNKQLKVSKETETARVEAEKREQERMLTLQANVNIVASRHPEVDNDPTSEKAQIFQEVLDNDPQLRSRTDGPLVAMTRMEDELVRRHGPGALFTARNPGNPPAQPLPGARPPARPNPSLPPSRPVLPNQQRVVLTKEDRAFCDENKIPYADFARSQQALKAGGGKGGISV